jgi:hypothetical protein
MAERPDTDAGRREGGCRKDAAHALLEARREALVRRGRRALLLQLLCAGTATADDVADLLGPSPADLDPRWLGTVPGALALAGIIKRAGFISSCRPSRHASTLSVWELADRGAALLWLARNPDLPDPEPEEPDESGDGSGAPCPALPEPPTGSPTTFAQLPLPLT